MKRTKALAAALLMGAAFSASAAPNATPDDAVAMVKKAVTAIQAHGRDKTLAEINNSQGDYRVQDLYLSVYRLDGMTLAHGTNSRWVGQQLTSAKDADGKPYVRASLQLAKERPAFWHDYKLANALTRKIEPRSMYCERIDDMVVCGGIYK